MSASSQTDAFAEAWKRSVTHKFNTGAGLDIPHPDKPPRVSIYATHELVHADKPFLTWEPELMLWRNQVPDVPKIRQTLIDLIPEDNFEQLEKVYQYIYAVAELEEYHKVRLEKANAEWEDWKHVAKEGRTQFDALIKKESRDNVSVAWQDALLDRAEGRVIRWAEIVAQEKERVQRQERKVDRLTTSSSEATALLQRRLGPVTEERPSTDVAWCTLAYLTARENAEVEVSGQAIDSTFAE